MSDSDDEKPVTVRYAGRALAAIRRIMTRYDCEFGEAISRSLGWHSAVLMHIPAGSKNRLLIESTEPDARGKRYFIRNLETGEEGEVRFAEVQLDNRVPDDVY